MSRRSEIRCLLEIVTPEEIQTILEDAGNPAAITIVDALDDFIQQPSHACMKCSKQFTPTPATTFFVMLNPQIERLSDTPFVYAGDDCGVAALCHCCLKKCEGDDMDTIVSDCFEQVTL
jgi:hypothetical protein